jgi:hypothetical protein
MNHYNFKDAAFNLSSGRRRIRTRVSRVSNLDAALTPRDGYYATSLLITLFAVLAGQYKILNYFQLVHVLFLFGYSLKSVRLHF